MKKTEWKVACGTRNGYTIYRVVMTDGKDFFVKWNGELINVNEDIKARRYTYR